MIPTLFHIGPFPVHSFGLMMMLAFIAAWRMLSNELEEKGKDPALAESLITWSAVGGIVGARLGYLVSFPNNLFDDPLGTIFGSAGFVFHWGFVGGFLGAWLLLRKEGERFLPLSDLAGPALAIGYAIGRIGCQLSGDGDYGKISDLPWAMSYPLGVVPTASGVFVHPTPVYESLMAVLTALLLRSVWVRARLRGTGQVFALYLLLTALARFVVEFLRVEPVIFPPFTQAQLMSIGLGLVALALYLRGKKLVA